jgi:hypothetical protein
VPVFTLAMRSRLSHDLTQVLDAPYGTVVDLVIDELEAAGFLRREPGYWGGVPAAARARELKGFERAQIEEKPERDAMTQLDIAHENRTRRALLKIAAGVVEGDEAAKLARAATGISDDELREFRDDCEWRARERTGSPASAKGGAA